MLENITPVVKKLLIFNVAIFVFSIVVPNGMLNYYGSFHNILLPENSGVMLNPNFKIWQIVTYMFLHAGIGHIFSNMFGLFIFGPALEHYMGGNKFLRYYILCGIGAALINSGVDFYQMTNVEQNSQTFMMYAQKSMVGASGAIFGILVAFAVLFPNVEMMLLFFPFPIKAKYFVSLYALYEIVAGTEGLQSGVAHWAHIGGLITGIILLKVFGYSNRNFR